LPVAGHGHGADEKSRLEGSFGPAFFFLLTSLPFMLFFMLPFMQEKSYQLHGLSQTHIVRQTGTQTYLAKVFQPGDAPKLVRAQCALELLGGGMISSRLPGLARALSICSIWPSA